MNEMDVLTQLQAPTHQGNKVLKSVVFIAMPLLVGQIWLYQK